MPSVFSNSEVMELCDSLKDIHRALLSLEPFFQEIETPAVSVDNALNKDFIRWGLMKISMNFLDEQIRKVNRIMDIYRQAGEYLAGGRHKNNSNDQGMW